MKRFKKAISVMPAYEVNQYYYARMTRGGMCVAEKQPRTPEFMANMRLNPRTSSCTAVQLCYTT